MDSLLNGGQPFIGSDCSLLSLTERDLRFLAGTGEVRRVMRGVYVDSRVDDSRELRAAALHLVKPANAAFYGPSVAFLLGLDVFPPGERRNFRPHCVVPHHDGRSRRDLVRCKEGYLKDEDLMVLNGLVVTTPLRATVDMLRFMWRPYAMSAADAMARAGHVTREEVMARVHSMRRFPGIVQARSLATLIEPLAESPGESWQRLALVDAGLPLPESQVEVYDRWDRFAARLDNAYREARVGVEYDGREWHDDEAKDHDQNRRGFLTDVLRWRIAVVTFEAVLGPLPPFEEQVAEWLGLTARPRPWWRGEEQLRRLAG